MSISSALSNALSGLTVSSRAADVVSSNIANAMTDGYGVRDLSISARITGGSGSGAHVVGVTRFEDPILSGYRRLSDAGLADIGVQAGFLTRMEQTIGTPDQAGSLVARAADFEAKLAAAANAPHSQAYLSAAIQSARDMVDQINAISNGIQAERAQADAAIADHVTTLNDALTQLSDLNVRIRRGQGGGRDVSSLLDAQAQILDTLTPLIPLQTRRDSMGALQIYSKDGHSLLDGLPAEFGFTPTAGIGADARIEDGTLSGLTLNGRPVSVSGGQQGLHGGALGALFQLRDDTAVAAQAQIDAVAADLAERFDAPGLDPTLAAGSPGLFTDAGALVDTADQTGLAGRLRVNAAVLPDQGGAVWRLRDGIGALTEGPVGQSALLIAQTEALSNLQPPTSGAFSSVSRSFAGLVSDHVSLNGTARQAAEVDYSHKAARHATIRQEELALGVDTDAEMQRLLQIEKTYAANARVVTAAEDMLDELMRIGR